MMNRPLNVRPKILTLRRLVQSVQSTNSFFYISKKKGLRRALFIIVFRLVREVVANQKNTRYAGAAMKVIYNQYRDGLREILRRLCEYKGVKIIEGELMTDYVYMLVLIQAKIEETPAFEI